MEELKIIPEEIWGKIERDRAEARKKRAELHLDVLTFIYENEDLHYIIGLKQSQGYKAPSRPKTQGAPKVRRSER
jgi:hypothetical protein